MVQPCAVGPDDAKRQREKHGERIAVKDDGQRVAQPQCQGNVFNGAFGGRRQAMGQGLAEEMVDELIHEVNLKFSLDVLRVSMSALSEINAQGASFARNELK